MKRKGDENVLDFISLFDVKGYNSTFMNKTTFILTLTLSLSSVSLSQSVPATQSSVVPGQKAVAASDNASIDLAKLVLAAHGGDKLKSMKSIVMKGSADVNVQGQSLPGVFSMAISGDKYYFEINAVVQKLKQVYDGQQTYSSMQPFSLPPMTSLGFPLLPRIGDAGYVISGLTDKKKKGFRITTPDGFYTDFFVDDKTKQIKGYESSYDLGGRIVTTSVEIDEFQTVEGVVVPKKYSQRFDLGQLTAYANFKTKDILINSPIDDSAFALPK